jgi:hypothetical protein
MAIAILIELLILALPDRALIRIVDLIVEWWWAAILVGASFMGDGILAKFGSVVEPAAEIFDTEDITYA